MSQYSRPLAVLVGVPVTLVGPAAAGFAAVFLAAVWPRDDPMSASSAIARITTFICCLQFFFESNGWSPSSKRDHVNLNQNVFRQPRYFNRRTRRRVVLEMAAVNFIHGGEVSH